jgi:hypothetical protein
VVALSPPDGPPAPPCAGPRPDRPHRPGQPAMWHRAPPGRAAPAGHRRQFRLDPPRPLARPDAATRPVLAHLLGQPRHPALGG